MHILESTTEHLIFDCHPLSHIRMMVELPTPRLILILSLMGLASFSLTYTLTSRWSHLIQKYRARVFSFWILARFHCLQMIISELQSLGVCILESCLLPCRRLSPTPSKVSRIDPNPFLDDIKFKLIVSLSLITGLFASYLCCALYLLHTETSSR